MSIEVMTRADLGVALRASLEDLTGGHPQTVVLWISSPNDLLAAQEAVSSGKRLIAVLQRSKAVSREAAVKIQAVRPETGPVPIWIWWGPGEEDPPVPAWFLDSSLDPSQTPLLEPADDLDLAARISGLAEGPLGARILLRNRHALRAHSTSAPPPPHRGTLLLEGTDACVLAVGAQVGEALAAAMDLQTQSIRLRVVRLLSIHPLDEALVRECAERPGPLLVAEPSGETSRPIFAEAVERLLGPAVQIERVIPRPGPPTAGGRPDASEDVLADEAPERGPSARDIRIAVTQRVGEFRRATGQDDRRV